MALSLAVACMLVACGGGGGESTAPGAPIANTSQEVTTSGGTVTLQGLSLAVPASSLASTTTLGLQQETVDSPALARFRFSPAGQVLNVPAELQYSAAGLPANARFFWEVNGERWMVPGTVSGGVLTSQISSLGFNAAGGVLRVQTAASLTERVQAAAARVLPLADSASEGGSVVVQPVDCDTHITVLKTRLARAATESDQNRAVGIFQDLQATREACAAVRLEELQQASCDALTVAQSKAEVLVADSVTTFKELTVPLYTAQAFVQTTGATCSNANEATNPALIEAKFNQLLDIMKGQMTRAEFDDTLTVRDLGVVMHLDVMCQQLGMDAICTRLSNELYPDLLDALRASAFAECRTNGNPLAVSQFYALGSQAGDDDHFFFHGRFSLAAVEADLNYCSNPSLGLRVFDGEAVPSELTDRATTLNPLVSMGNYAKQKTIEVPRDGSLNIAGTVGVLRCPDGSASGADLVFRVNGQEWVRRTASGNAYPLESAPLLLDLPTVLPGLGLNPETSTGFTVTVNREGGACSDGNKAVLDTPFTLFEVKVGLPGKGTFVGTLTFTQEETFTEVQTSSTRAQRWLTVFSADVALTEATRLQFTKLNVSRDYTWRLNGVSQIGLEGDNCRYILTWNEQEQYKGVTVSPGTQDHATVNVNVNDDTWTLESVVFNALYSGSISATNSYSNTANCSGYDTTDTSSETPIAPYRETLQINFFDPSSPSGLLKGNITRDANGRRIIRYSGTLQTSYIGGALITTTNITLNLSEAP